MKTIDDINSVFDRDPSARNKFEIIICYSGVQAMIFYRIANYLWGIKLKLLARFLSSFARWVTGIEIHPAAVIGDRFFIDHGMGVVIGETTVIGNDVTIYQGVTLGGTSWNKGKRHPTIEDNIVIGAGAKILGPITLKRCSKIGSNAVVVKSVEEGNTVVGVPGRVLISNESGNKKFDAYGTSNAGDPTVKAVNSMLEHILKLDEQIHQLNEKLAIVESKV